MLDIAVKEYFTVEISLTSHTAPVNLRRRLESTLEYCILDHFSLKYFLVGGLLLEVGIDI
jgi:hypothetical protein